MRFVDGKLFVFGGIIYLVFINIDIYLLFINVEINLSLYDFDIWLFFILLFWVCGEERNVELWGLELECLVYV